MIWASSEGFKVDSITWQEGEGRKEEGGTKRKREQAKKTELDFYFIF